MQVNPNPAYPTLHLLYIPVSLSGGEPREIGILAETVENHRAARSIRGEEREGKDGDRHSLLLLFRSVAVVVDIAGNGICRD